MLQYLSTFAWYPDPYAVDEIGRLSQTEHCEGQLQSEVCRLWQLTGYKKIKHRAIRYA